MEIDDLKRQFPEKMNLMTDEIARLDKLYNDWNSQCQLLNKINRNVEEKYKFLQNEVDAMVSRQAGQDKSLIDELSHQIEKQVSK